jgi:hypothetical protein
MGVGKTLVALAARRVLISCPLRVPLIVTALKAEEAGRA